MITGYRWRADRALLVALILSLILHFSGAALYGLLNRELTRLHLLAPRPRATEQVVTTSQSITFDRRPRPAPAHRAAPSRPVQQQVARVPLSPSLPKVEMQVPHYAPPALLKPELSRTVPHAQPQGTPHPKPLQVALAPHEPEHAAHAPAGGELSPQQLAQLNADFARTISQARSVENPLRVPPRPPLGPKRYTLQFDGRITDLRNGEGLLTPIKEWYADGYNYYYVTYEIVWPDGTYESGAVPWPIRYRPRQDPFADPRPGQLFPLPPPLPGYVLPPGIQLGRALRPYFSDQATAN